MSCEGTSGPALPGEPPSEVLPWGSGHPRSQDGASHRGGLGTRLGAGWGHWIARRSPAHESAHEDHAGARAWGWPGGLSCCSITIPVGHGGCAGTASSHPLLPSHRTGSASRPAPPSFPVLVLTSVCSERAAVAEESPRAGGARRGTTQEGQGTSREAKPCSEVPMQHCLPEKPPCLCPGVNEPEIIRADSHLAAVCGYLLLEQPLRRQVPAQVLPSGAGKEFEGEIFHFH